MALNKGLFQQNPGERDDFLRWLDGQKSSHRPVGKRILAQTDREKRIMDHEYLRGAYEAYLAVLAYVKTGGRL